MLDGVSLRVFPGEVVALVGESGSGKTTLIRTIQGLQPFQSGSIEVNGEVATGAHRDDIQMVFQDPTGALNPRRTVYESVAEGIQVKGRAPDEAARVDRGAGHVRAASRRAGSSPCIPTSCRAVSGRGW